MYTGTHGYRLRLTGFPLEHSLSPKIHAAALDACGLEGEYSLYPITPNDLYGLKQLLNKLRIGELHGLNVTIPHKQNVIEYLDELTPTARAIGAVNTIYFRDGKLIGENTDAPGFAADLDYFLAKHQSKTLAPDASAGVVNRKSAIVLGAGGSARAVVYALLNDGWQVTIAARRLEQARQLALSFPEYAIRITQFADFRLAAFNLLVNTTPLGMTPNIDSSPLSKDFPFPPHSAVYDLVYNPRETKLVRQARAQGLAAATGLGMLIEQAALAFEIWTGQRPPRDLLLQSVLDG